MLTIETTLSRFSDIFCSCSISTFHLVAVGNTYPIFSKRSLLGSRCRHFFLWYSLRQHVVASILNVYYLCDDASYNFLACRGKVVQSSRGCKAFFSSIHRLAPRSKWDFHLVVRTWLGCFDMCVGMSPDLKCRYVLSVRGVYRVSDSSRDERDKLSRYVSARVVG